MRYSYRYDRQFPCTVTLPNGRTKIKGTYEGRAPYDVAVSAVIDCLRTQRSSSIQAIIRAENHFIVDVEDGYTHESLRGNNRRRRAFPGSAGQKVMLRLSETGAPMFANVTQGVEARRLQEYYSELDSVGTAP